MQADFVDAVGRGQVDRAEALRLAGAGVDVVGNEGMTPLLWCMAKQNLEGLQFLLRNGANPNDITRWKLATGREQAASAMHLAAIMEDSRFLSALIAHGGNPDLVKDSGQRTPIYEALMHRRTRNVALLLDRGANINHQDMSRTTPINHAANSGAYALALLLLARNADPTIADRWGYSAVGTTKQFGNGGVRIGSADDEAYPEFVGELKRRGLW